MEFWKIFLFSPISLKIWSFIVQDKYICVIFEFSDFAQKMWKKIRFKYEMSDKFYKRFSCKKNYMGILCKMNTNQNYMQFFCNFFCWRSLVNLQGNSFIKYKMDIFTKDFHAKKHFHENSFLNESISNLKGILL